MKDYQHIVLTRFNIQYEDGWMQHLQEEWLNSRFSLFENYCLPSMLNQTCQDFKWILLSDERTPEPYRTRLLAYRETMPQIDVVFWAPHYEDDYHEMLQQLGERLVGNHDWLLSSRLDNDDMLEQTYIERIHKYAETQVLTNSILTYLNGSQYFVKEGISFKVGYQYNHFSTFCEEKGNIHTSLGMNHVLVPKRKLLLIETAKDMWCEIVHSSNICNDYVPKYHYYWQQPHGQYPIALPITPWWKHIPFLVPRWFSFRLAQFKRLKHRILRCGRSV